MELNHISEPKLIFGTDKDISPKRGIANYSVYDINLDARKTDLLLGIVALDEDVEKIFSFLESFNRYIPAPAESKQTNLNVAFPGFNKDQGYRAELKFSNEITRRVNLITIKKILEEKNRKKRIVAAVNEFYKHCKFLAEDKKVDIIICVVPKLFEKSLVEQSNQVEIDQTIEDEFGHKNEMDFRRYLKAKCLEFDTPIQLIREYVLSESKKIQDKATVAWNFCTGIYYKAMQTIPWKLDRDINLPPACYVGVSFFKSRDRKVLNTSIAQVFNENGNGIILRGGPVAEDKEDRIPHLSYEQSYDLLHRTLDHYSFVVTGVPGRLVLHKTSKFYEDELMGFEDAAKKFNVHAYDFINIQETDIRLFRYGLYPPNRGTYLKLSDDKILLYTRGSVQHYQTYPGLYIPAPILINIEKNASSHNTICKEILGLTKMNWNNTQIDGKYPITIGCSRKVGEIMKYLDMEDMPKPKTKYAFYM